MIRRIFTDIPQDQLPMMANAIAIDNGTFTSEAQEDGNFTVYVEFPGDPSPEQPPAPGTHEFPWMPIAFDNQGVAEGPGDARITQYFSSTSLGPQPSSVPWCSAFVNFCVERSGNAGTKSALARSWLSWGQNAPDLTPGCIVILSRGSPALGHVGFYVGQDRQGAIRLLGGNQHNSVNISSFPKAEILGRRILAPAGKRPVPTTPSAAASGNAAGGFNLASILPQRRGMAMHIIEAFAAAGFGRVQQAAGLANAIAESGLDPRARATTAREDSVGLFQLNRAGGAGIGHSPEELMDPDANLAIAIAEVKNITQFVAATTLEAAVDAFLEFFERPADIPPQSAQRLEIAQRLLG